MDIIGELKNTQHLHGASTTEAVHEGKTNPAPTVRTESSSIDSLDHESERKREYVRSRNPQGFSQTSTGVDVQRAEAEFAELSKELSGLSQHSRRTAISRVVSRRSTAKATDLEKATSDESDETERWDLEDVLRGAKVQEYEAGIKSKRIGKFDEGLVGAASC